MTDITLQCLRESADKAFKASEYRRALDLYSDVLQDHPNETSASDIRKYAVCLIELGEWEKAAVALAKWEELEVNSAILYSMKAHVFKMLNDLAATETALRRSVELRPRASGYCLLGDHLAEKGDEETAIAMFKEAIKCDSNYGEAFYNLGVMLQKRLPEEAAAYFAKAAELGTNSGGNPKSN